MTVRLFNYKDKITAKSRLGIEKNQLHYDLETFGLGFPNDIKKIIENDYYKNTLLNFDSFANYKPMDNEKIEFLCPIINPGKMICLGLNYVNHLLETKYDKPTYPVFFARFNSSYVAHNQEIIKPSLSEKCDYEGELAVIIGKNGRYIKKENAYEYIAGYSIFNDITIRDYQSKSTQWLAGKNFDKAGAFGPYLVFKDSIPSLGKNLNIKTHINGKKLQDDYTCNMLFSVEEIIEYIAEFTELKIGDVIVTGTPSGVGFAQDPKLYLKNGDLCEIEIDNLGILKNRIKEENEQQ